MAFFHFTLAALTALGCVLAVSAATCQSNSDCAGGQHCVLHANYSSRANCETERHCADVSDSSCTCQPGYECRLKDCPSDPYECLFLEHKESRCGGRSGPQCGSNQVCGYARTGLVCIKCPCYGTDRAVCVDKRPGAECGLNSIVQVNQDNSYVCKGCASATSVLTR
uniref:Cysteine-rich protein n=1 Tax=Haemaphysalis flava TaxID=181088 RepID=A0A5B9BYB0_HAEFA|nr:cysteine-rich protein [Haemaphysalis flava]